MFRSAKFAPRSYAVSTNTVTVRGPRSVQLSSRALTTLRAGRSTAVLPMTVKSSFSTSFVKRGEKVTDPEDTAQLESHTLIEGKTTLLKTINAVLLTQMTVGLASVPAVLLSDADGLDDQTAYFMAFALPAWSLFEYFSWRYFVKRYATYLEDCGRDNIEFRTLSPLGGTQRQVAHVSDFVGKEQITEDKFLLRVKPDLKNKLPNFLILNAATSRVVDIEQLSAFLDKIPEYEPKKKNSKKSQAKESIAASTKSEDKNQ